MGRRMRSAGRAGAACACAAAVLIAFLGCSNPLANMVKDVALQNTASLASLSITAGTTDLRLSPGFSTSILAYRTLATRSVTQVTVKAVAADADAKVTVNGQAAVATGVSVLLVQGGVNEVLIAVSSASGLEQKTYKIGVSRGIIRQLTGGGSFNLAVNGDGTLWTWGSGSTALGDGTYTGRSLPAWVSGIAEVRSASTIFYHVLALKEDGTVWSWGGNWGGQLGDGTLTDRDVPGQVAGAGGAGNLSDITAVAAGWDHSLALKSDGTVWAWGSNYAGALGDNTTTNRSFPVRVQGGLTTVDAIAAGSGFSLALKHDGTVWAWGANWSGQLGDNSRTDKKLPVQVSGLTGVKAIASGANFGLALMADNSVKAWGSNGESQIGDGTTIDRLVPVAVGVGVPPTGVQMIAASWTHSVALKSDGNVYTWGSNWKGEGGDGTITIQSTPHLVSGLPPAVLVGIGAQSVLALTQDDKVYWWGSNYYQPSSIFTTPVQVQGMTAVGASVSAGAGHSVAYKPSDSTVWTWGDNYVGQIGRVTTMDVSTATQVTSLSTLNAAVAAGSMHTLALRIDGAMRAWGYGPDGQLGDGLGTNSATPVTVTGLTGTMTAIAAGYYHSLARKSDGTVWAWGRNSNGQLGDNTTINRWAAVQVTGLTGASAIAGGESHSLALVGIAVKAWGFNGNGQLGNGTNDNRLTPTDVAGLTGITAIACGAQHSLALKSNDTVWAWGGGWLGQLGNGTTMNVNVPVQVTGLTGITAIAAGNSHNLALKGDGTVWAWGTNQFGQLGTGNFLSSNVPVQVSGLTGVTAIGAGAAFSLAVKLDGTVWAWGSGESGQLGNGTIAFQFAPVLLNWP
jgi:alpha-tubulin suppressor-like RCC1 family protein